jgi:AcrR family transcriptional regulator
MGPLGTAPGLAEDERGSRQRHVRRGIDQQADKTYVPLGNQGSPQGVQAGVKASPTDLPAESPAAASAPARPAAPAQRGRPGGAGGRLRPSLDGGVPALQRELGAHGRDTVRRLLAAGLVEFEEAGFQAARVEDIVRRAKTSHGTFYLYFANKDDLFRTLLRDALVDMASITDEFPVVTSNDAGRAALRRWVQSFCDTYAAHATVIRILSQAEIVGESVFSDGLQLFFRLSEVMTQGMTAAQTSAAGDGVLTEHAELTAVACLMMLERINYLMSAEVRLPKDEMIDRLTAIIYAAFRS